MSQFNRTYNVTLSSGELVTVGDGTDHTYKAYVNDEGTLTIVRATGGFAKAPVAAEFKAGEWVHIVRTDVPYAVPTGSGLTITLKDGTTLDRWGDIRHIKGANAITFNSAGKRSLHEAWANGVWEGVTMNFGMERPESYAPVLDYDTIPEAFAVPKATDEDEDENEDEEENL